jgi:hypothetical protein
MGDMTYQPEEFDLVVLKEAVAPWPAGTKAIVVDVGDRAALVEVVESTPGLRSVPADDRVVEARYDELRLVRHARLAASSGIE